MKSVRSTPSLAFAILAALALLLVALSIAPRAQSQLAAPAPQAYQQLVDQLKKQQEAMVANQAKIDEQVSNIKEEIRMIRIFSKRSG
jgi:PBP1b-binding outer membrane lipoprotein LpoB